MIRDGRTRGLVRKARVVGAMSPFKNREMKTKEPYYLLDSEDCRLVDSEDNVLTVKR